MPKLNVKITVKNDVEDTSYQVPAMIQDDVIKYVENKETIVEYNYRNNILYRENKDLIMKYRFDKEKHTLGEIRVKELEKDLKIKIKTNKIERDQNHLKTN